MAFSSALHRVLKGSSFITSQFVSVRFRSTLTARGAQNISSERPIRQFVSSKGKSAGRNSAGRITIFHRGGGAKQLQRKIDLKRNTSSLGVVERIEYDPSRTSRIAVVRWVEGAGLGLGQQKKINTLEELPPPHKIHDPTLTSIKGQFSFSSLPGMEEKRKVISSKPTANHVVIGLPKLTFSGSKTPFTSNAIGSKITSPKDVFFSALSFDKTKGYKASYSFVHSLGLPRIAIAGAKPDFFAPKMKNEIEENESLSLGEIRKWDKNSAVWGHKIKRKAAVSWQSFRRQKTLGLVGVNKHNETKQKVKAINKVKKDGKYKVGRAPVTYVIASHKLEPGKMVMNCDLSKRFDTLSTPVKNARGV